MNSNRWVEDYIEQLPEELSYIATEIRKMIAEIVPDAQETYSFRIPFYKYFGMFCYLNTLGKKNKTLCLTFLRGKDLVEMYPQLQQRGRAIAASLIFASEQQFNPNEVKEILTSAAIWQKEAYLQGLKLVKASTKEKRSREQ